MEKDKCPLCFENIGVATRQRKCPACKEKIYVCGIPESQTAYWCNQKEKEENPKLWEEYREKKLFQDELLSEGYSVGKFDRMLAKVRRKVANGDFEGGLKDLEDCKIYALQKKDAHDQEGAERLATVYFTGVLIYGQSEDYQKSLENYVKFSFWSIVQELSECLTDNLDIKLTDQDIENVLKRYPIEFKSVFYHSNLDILKAILKFGSLRNKHFLELFTEIDKSEIEKANTFLFDILLEYFDSFDDEDYEDENIEKPLFEEKIEIIGRIVSLSDLAEEIEDILDVNFPQF